MDTLETTREFWDTNPCLADLDRYANEQWLMPLLERIAATNPASVLEIGCGQGVDAATLTTLIPNARYVAIDLSPENVRIAQSHAPGAHIRQGNVESLDFADNDFDVVYSCGVIHHTSDDRRGIEEVRRVLKPGGAAYICLYRWPSLKVGAAWTLRAFQSAIDVITRKERFIYRMLLRNPGHKKIFGTMLEEGFGVPHLKAYTRTEIEKLFSIFSHFDIRAEGCNLTPIVKTAPSPNPRGHFWVIEATK